MTWAESQRYERGYDTRRWGIRHSRDYWLRFLSYASHYPALEVGCGDSGLWRFDPQVTGLDPLDYSHLATNFVRGESEALPFPDNSFHDCLCVNALDHTRDPEAAMREMRRVAQRLVLWTYIFPTALMKPLYHPHPHALTLTRVSRMLKGLNITYWRWVNPWTEFSGNATPWAKAKLAAMTALNVRALLVHTEAKL